MKILSFCLAGHFAAFRDPSITTAQSVYYIPSKSAIIGLLGALIGVQRDTNLGEIYGKEYLEIFSATKIGLSFNSKPKKVVFFTNHRSLKEPKTKPFKTELVESPNYTIFVKTEEQIFERLEKAIKNNEYSFSPYLGHVYCPAIVSELQVHDAEETESNDKITSCVILDESETFQDDSKTFQDDSTFFNLQPLDENNSRVIVERHLHHFILNDKLERRVLKHWIPVGGSFRIERDEKRKLSYFVRIKDKIVCLY